MNITGTPEYKKEVEKESACPYPSRRELEYFLHGHKRGAEFAEYLLTAQHDKGMEELLIWIEYNFRKMIGNENYKKYNYEDGSYSEKLYSRAELLQLFRNRK